MDDRVLSLQSHDSRSSTSRRVVKITNTAIFTSGVLYSVPTPNVIFLAKAGQISHILKLWFAIVENHLIASMGQRRRKTICAWNCFEFLQPTGKPFKTLLHYQRASVYTSRCPFYDTAKLHPNSKVTTANVFRSPKWRLRCRVRDRHGLGRSSAGRPRQPAAGRAAPLGFGLSRRGVDRHADRFDPNTGPATTAAPTSGT